MSTTETNRNSQLQEEIERNRPVVKRAKQAAKKLTRQVMAEIKNSDGREITVEVDEPVLHQIVPRYGLHKHDNIGLTENITRTMLGARGVEADIVLEETPRDIWDIKPHSNRVVTVSPKAAKTSEGTSPK